MDSKFLPSKDELDKMRAEEKLKEEMAKEQRGLKWDTCIADGVFKLGGCLAVGGLVSILLKCKAWPLYAGLGFGFGRTYSNCVYLLKSVEETKEGKRN